MNKLDITVSDSISVKEALKKLDQTSKKTLLIVDNDNILKGTLSDGDVRRYLLTGKSLEITIKGIYNSKPYYLFQEDYSIEEAQKLLLDQKIELIPIVDKKLRYVNYITWDQVFSIKRPLVKPIIKISTPVVIMAGGKGTRLEPFTSILPKPLIPIGEKSVMEIIMEEFNVFGIREFYFTLNYKGRMIKAYFDDLENDYDIKYIWEKDFCGTAGSLKLLPSTIADVFIVSNCDIIVKANYDEVIKQHKEKKASMTVLSSIQHYKIPYGVVEFTDGGVITGIKEKPEYTFPVNAGVYILNKECLENIPDGVVFNMTDLIFSLLKKGKKVITYPVNESEYIDIGQWTEYKETVGKL